VRKIAITLVLLVTLGGCRLQEKHDPVPPGTNTGVITQDPGGRLNPADPRPVNPASPLGG
jgi:hypothetical protein